MSTGNETGKPVRTLNTRNLDDMMSAVPQPTIESYEQSVRSRSSSTSTIRAPSPKMMTATDKAAVQRKIAMMSSHMGSKVGARALSVMSDDVFDDLPEDVGRGAPNATPLANPQPARLAWKVRVRNGVVTMYNALTSFLLNAATMAIGAITVLGVGTMVGVVWAYMLTHLPWQAFAAATLVCGTLFAGLWTASAAADAADEASRRRAN